MSQKRAKNLKWFNDHYKSIGYDAALAKNGHYKVTDPDGRYVTTLASTPSDHRAMKNSQAVVKRHERNRQAMATVHAASRKAVPA